MTHPTLSTPRQSDFLAIPESPVAYWIPENILQTITTGTLFGEKFVCAEGLGTRDDTRFLRFFWEVIRLPQFITLAKGGGYCKWKGLNENKVYWTYDGAKLKAFGSELYGGSHWSRQIRNTHLYFNQAATYSSLSRGSLGARLLLKDQIFGEGSPIVLNKQEEPVYKYLCLLNSRVVSYILRAFSPQLTFRFGYLINVPLPYNNLNDKILNFIGKWCVSAAEILLSTSLVSSEFSLISAQNDTINTIRHTLEAISEKLCLESYRISQKDQAVILTETGTPAGFHPLLTGYDALPELPADGDLPPLPPAVLDYLARHERITPAPDELARITANLRTLYEAGPGARDVELDEGEATSGDEDDAGGVSGAHIPIPTETFLEELSVKLAIHPLSVYWLLAELRAAGVRCTPEECRRLEDRLSVIVLRLLGYRWPQQIEAGEPLPDWAVTQGVIPLVPGTGQPTLVERVRARLRAEDGDLGAQHTEALLTELTGMSLDDWLRREFFKRHIRQFKYRPIAWHLASRPATPERSPGRGKRSAGSGRRLPAFACLLFYHACDGDVLARIRTQSVDPLLRVERQRLEAARRSNQETEAAQAQACISELEEFSRRLLNVAERGFDCPALAQVLADEPLDRWSGDGYEAPAARDDLLRQERAWRVDINDGVRVNIAPLQQADLLTSAVLKPADAQKALADRVRWRSDERRWVRQGKLPRCGWMPDAVPESPAWLDLAPQRAAERAKLAEKRKAVGREMGE